MDHRKDAMIVLGEGFSRPQLPLRICRSIGVSGLRLLCATSSNNAAFPASPSPSSSSSSSSENLVPPGDACLGALRFLDSSSTELPLVLDSELDSDDRADDDPWEALPDRERGEGSALRGVCLRATGAGLLGTAVRSVRNCCAAGLTPVFAPPKSNMVMNASNENTDE